MEKAKNAALALLAVGMLANAAATLRPATAAAANALTVDCKSFSVEALAYTKAGAQENADALGAEIKPWLEQELASGGSVQLHSFFATGAKGGAELVCVAHP